MLKKRTIILILIALGFIFLIAYLYTRSLPPLTLISSVPENGQGNQAVDTSISFLFSRAPSENEKNKISVKLSPAKDIKTEWVGKEFVITPQGAFDFATKYTMEIDFNGSKLIDFSFSTIYYNSTDNSYVPNDILFNQAYDTFLKQYPWYKSLPIDNSNYTVIYDFDRRSFRIRIKLSNISASQKQKLVDQALADLRNIGFAASPIPYYVLTP